MGVAVLEGTELVYWGVSSFRMHGEDALVAAVLDRMQGLIAVNQPTILALEAPRSLRLAASPLLRPVVAGVKGLA